MPIVGPVSEDMQTVEGVQVPVYILKIDKHGTLISPQSLQHLVARLEAGVFTDVLLMSHGWNNTYDEALQTYEWLFLGMESLRGARGIAAEGYRPVVLGLQWPSIALLLPGEQGPRIAAMMPVDERPVFAEATSDPARVEQLLGLERLDRSQAVELAGLLGLDEPADELAEIWARTSALQDATEATHGTAGWGDADHDDASGPEAAFEWQYLDPRWAYRMATVWQMKDRAQLVGAKGGAEVLRTLAGRGARVSLFGHSYGCQVLLSALCQPTAVEVEAAVLLQPAVNTWAFAERVPDHDVPGGFRPALHRCNQPIVVTHTKKDAPLFRLFHKAVRRKRDLGEIGPRPALRPPPKFGAMGGYGPAGMAGGELCTVPLTDDYTPLPAGGHEVVLLTAHTVIGGHSDIQKDPVYWVAWQVVSGGRWP